MGPLPRTSFDKGSLGIVTGVVAVFAAFCLGAQDFFFFIDFTERMEETDISLLFHIFMYSLVASCTCPDQAWNPQPWHIGMVLYHLSYPAKARGPGSKQA